MAAGMTLLALCGLAAATPQSSADAPSRSLSEEPDPPPRLVLPDESAYSASPSDGRGQARLAPRTVEVSTPVTLQVRFVVGAEGIAVGGGVRFSISKFWGWTPPQTRDREEAGFVTVQSSRQDMTLDVRALPDDGFVFAIVRGAALRGGDELVFTYGDTGDGANPGARAMSDRFAERGERVFIKVDGDGDGFYTALAEQPAMDVFARREDRYVAFAPSQARVGAAFEVTVAALDRTFNLVESHVSRALKITAEGAATIEEIESIRFGEAHRGALRFKVTPRAVGLLHVTVEGSEGSSIQRARTNPVLVDDAPSRPYTLVWGDLQIHTRLSDGSGDPADVYRYARDVARLDAAAITDHDHWGYAPLDGDARSWSALLALSREWNRDGAFIAFPGYEWTNWTHGHRHVLFAREEEAEIFSYADKSSDHPLELWGKLGGRDCLTLSHHCGGGPMPTFWKYCDPRYEPVVEMASVHGVSEMIGHPRCIRAPVESGMVQAALARGHRLGLIGSGDTHDGHPGLGSPGQRAGLAGMWVKSLTRAGVFEALRARRVYATTGCRAILRFHAEGAGMGSVMRLERADQPRRFTVSVVADAAPIQSITLVRNNQPAVTVPGAGMVQTFEWTDTQPARDGDYMYARICQEDGEWIWSSPIWIEMPDGR